MCCFQSRTASRSFTQVASFAFALLMIGFSMLESIALRLRRSTWRSYSSLAQQVVGLSPDDTVICFERSINHSEREQFSFAFCFASKHFQQLPMETNLFWVLMRLGSFICLHYCCFEKVGDHRLCFSICKPICSLLFGKFRDYGPNQARRVGGFPPSGVLSQSVASSVALCINIRCG